MTQVLCNLQRLVNRWLELKTLLKLSSPPSSGLPQPTKLGKSLKNHSRRQSQPLMVSRKLVPLILQIHARLKDPYCQVKEVELPLCPLLPEQMSTEIFSSIQQSMTIHIIDLKAGNLQ